jgi:hypothetical protein
MRSLDRRRLYEIFAPLDADERLPRELLIEGRRFRSVGRRELAGFLWLPALLVSITAVGQFGVTAIVVTAAAVLAGLALLAKSGSGSP